MLDTLITIWGKETNMATFTNIHFIFQININKTRDGEGIKYLHCILTMVKLQDIHGHKENISTYL